MIEGWPAFRLLANGERPRHRSMLLRSRHRPKDSIFTILRRQHILSPPGDERMARTALRQPVIMSGDLTARVMFAGRSSSLSAQIVTWVRDALFAKKLKPSDFLGTEKDLAARFGVSRIVARDALRTLE
ncbi:MAG: GntR family transcriptional regulator, partial [Pseudolabrys sp.]